jgi:hypothetical protein
VIGAVDIHNRQCALEFQPLRGHKDTLPFILKNILPGTTIHTDCLATYKILSIYLLNTTLLIIPKRLRALMEYIPTTLKGFSESQEVNTCIFYKICECRKIKQVFG